MQGGKTGMQRWKRQWRRANAACVRALVCIVDRLFTDRSFPCALAVSDNAYYPPSPSKTGALFQLAARAKETDDFDLSKRAQVKVIQ